MAPVASVAPGEWRPCTAPIGIAGCGEWGQSTYLDITPAISNPRHHAPRRPITMAGAHTTSWPGANRRRQSFCDDDDRRFFLNTLSQACGRTGWRIHGWVLMGNHYHLLIQTPEPNLVDGMKMAPEHLHRASTPHRLWAGSSATATRRSRRGRRGLLLRHSARLHPPQTPSVPDFSK